MLDASPAVVPKPILLFFSSKTKGRSRRAEGYLAQVLQRRRNHDTFSIRFVAEEEHPYLIERFRVAATPTLLVVAEAKVQGRLVDPGCCEEIQAFLAPWLR